MNLDLSDEQTRVRDVRLLTLTVGAMPMRKNAIARPVFGHQGACR